MTLEATIKVLELGIKNKLNELDTNLLKDQDVQHNLTTFFAEQQVRPELIGSIKSQSLMYDYLQLELEEREELDRFRLTHGGYLDGEDNDIRGLEFIIKSERSGIFIRKQRDINQILRIFDFYLKNREEGDVFNPCYFKRNKKLKEGFGRLGINIYQKAYNLLRDEGGINKIIALASEINPQIRIYSDRKEVFKIDGVAQLLRIFDFYLENKAEGQTFGSGYLGKDKKLKEQFKGLGSRIRNNVVRHLKEEGGLNFLIKLASEINPQIRIYSDRKEVFKIDGVAQLLRIFDFYLENKAEGQTFNTGYLENNQELNRELKGLGKNLYSYIRKNFKEEGINYLIQLAAQQQPEILDYWKYREHSKDKNDFIQRALKQFDAVFNFYIRNREGAVFNANYLKSNKKLNEELDNTGAKLYGNVKTNLKEEGGINYLVQLAAQQQPEILEHWKYDHRKGKRKKSKCIQEQT